MKVNSKRDMSFKSIYTSPIIKKGLEFAADNGSLFAAGTTLALSLGVRPISILATPNTDVENKKYAFVKSFVSSIIGYILMLAVSKPVANKIADIDKNQTKYLTKETIEAFKDKKAYSFATQMFKLGIGFLAAIPKAILTAAAVPPVMEKVFPPKDENKDLTFKGKITDILNNKNYHKFSQKFKDTNFPMHFVALTDTLTTGTFIYNIKKSKKIKEERKNPLCYNSAIATALSIISSYTADRLTQKPTQKFIEKFKSENKNAQKLDKYVEGIKIAKPILLTGLIYYMLIPFISTYLADRIKN